MAVSTYRTTPVSLPLTSTLPAPGTTILPTSITNSLASHALPSHHPVVSHSHSHSHSNSFSSTNSALSNNQNNTTRILLLSDFAPELKTRDIQRLFEEWEEDRGGFKIKWSDDVSCWIVFNDPSTGESFVLSGMLLALLGAARGGTPRWALKGKGRGVVKELGTRAFGARLGGQHVAARAVVCCSLKVVRDGVLTSSRALAELIRRCWTLCGP